jgi:hypothetical protein
VDCVFIYILVLELGCAVVRSLINVYIGQLHEYIFTCNDWNKLFILFSKKMFLEKKRLSIPLFG